MDQKQVPQIQRQRGEENTLVPLGNFHVKSSRVHVTVATVAKSILPSCQGFVNKKKRKFFLLTKFFFFLNWFQALFLLIISN